MTNQVNSLAVHHPYFVPGHRQPGMGSLGSPGTNLFCNGTSGLTFYNYYIKQSGDIIQQLEQTWVLKKSSGPLMVSGLLFLLIIIFEFCAFL